MTANRRVAAAVEVGVFSVLLLLGFSCQKSGGQQSDYVLKIPLGLEALPYQIPEDNPITLEKVRLGRKLYFDERLSLDGTISCASCHNPLLGFADGRSVAMGITGLRGRRNTPTIVNRLYGKTQLLDGRAPSLEAQIIHPIENPVEMNNTMEHVVEALEADEAMREEFAAAFGSDVTADAIVKAIATFQRTILSGNSPYDRFQAGVKKALSESAQRGLALFMSERLRCSVCHSGPNFTDEKFHNTGVGQNIAGCDLGRFEVTKNDTDRGRFKTPTLRDIARTAPYMHDGSMRTLKDVVNFYDNGGRANENLSKLLRPLHLTGQEKTDLIFFLRSLSGANPLATNRPNVSGTN